MGGFSFVGWAWVKGRKSIGIMHFWFDFDDSLRTCVVRIDYGVLYPPKTILSVDTKGQSEQEDHHAQ